MKKAILNSKTVIIVEDGDIGKSGICGEKIDVLICTHEQWFNETLRTCVMPCLKETSTIVLI